MKNPNVPSATKENINHTNHKKENVMKPKRLTLPEKAQALFDHEEITLGMAHIAIALLMNKSYEQLSQMYGTSLAPGLCKLKKLGVVSSNGRTKWEFNHKTSDWGKPAQKREEEKSTDVNALLEIVSDLEKRLSDVKKACAKKPNA